MTSEPMDRNRPPPVVTTDNAGDWRVTKECEGEERERYQDETDIERGSTRKRRDKEKERELRRGKTERERERVRERQIRRKKEKQST